MRNKIEILIAMFLLLHITTTNLSAQVLPDSTTKKIDSLFKEWNTRSGPGCAIGIVRNDSLIYAKGYGLANLEYAVPNSPVTIYHMASVSKQFTAYSIVLLAKQGKLSLEDDIHKYLPWFPDLKAKITIRQLLNHTSGIRDQWQLLAISGTRLDDVITQDHIVKILARQKALNFPPGQQFNYSNSGYTMLAEIVKSITKQTLRSFTDSAIFKPLGMSKTHFHDDYMEIVNDRSYSYERKDSSHFQNSILSYSNAGATSLFTNVNDMSKWIMNFYQLKVGDQKDIQQLTQKGKLNSGKELSYALGIEVDKYKGWTQYSHGGGDAGYRTYITVFPDLKLGFIVFSNLADFDPRDKVYKIADLFINDTIKANNVTKERKRDSIAAVLKDTMSIRSYLGDFIDENGFQISFGIKQRQLYNYFYGQNILLMQESVDTFSMLDNAAIRFAFALKGKDTTVDIITPDREYHLRKYTKDTAQSDAVLKAYVGKYYCPELDCTYGIALKNHRLMLTNSKYKDTKLTLVQGDDLISDSWWISHLKVLRNRKMSITGFEVNDGRVMHLRFNKIQ